eukprot:TRINITY_DN3348_c0_g1_i11.p2 TRINITY_DN3348_c0_g1~~TRINITY_DN3348_c0_g1_i11.p2  ORF type:complete len:424 (+),score=160.69 TRINITY_DN3348_c0_g1_i11:548-1819(+)
MILGLIWQILKVYVLCQINLKHCPALVRLLNEGEELQDLLKLSPEDLLLRWFNYHLKAAGYPKTIKNFSDDVKDGEAYTILLNQLSPAKCDKSGLEKTGLERAAKVIDDAKKIGATSFTKPEHIVSGNPKINLLFAASIFNANTGLVANEQEVKDAAGLLDDDIEGSREERAFRMWINSLGLENVYVNNLYEDIKDGVVLLKVLDRVKPGSVEWKKSEKNPNNKFKKLQNANLAIDVGKAMGFTLVGIGGVDLVDGKKKLSLGLVWQVVRKHTLEILGGWTEEKLLAWANERAAGNSKAVSFKDPSIKTSVWLFDVLRGVEPTLVDPALVSHEEGPENYELNAKYALSCARKLGATVFCLWEDIVEVKPKMIMAFVAALAEIFIHGKKEALGDIYSKASTANQSIQWSYLHIKIVLSIARDIT